MMQPLLSVDRLTHLYAPGKGFCNVSFDLWPGEVLGIVGESGSGKTTLLKLMLGQLQADSGRIHVGTKLEVAYFDQHRAELDPDRTVMDNLAEGKQEVMVNGKPRHVLGYLQDFLFHPKRAMTPVRALSGGERNRLLLARLFLKPSNLLILDEPFDGLDVNSRRQLADHLATLHDAGYTLVLVLNRFDDIPDFVPFAGVLADCTLTEIGEKKALLEQTLIAQLAHSEKLSGMTLPEPDAPSARLALPDGQPRIVLRDGVVSYNDRPIINHLSWTVAPGEHWQVVGPNGAGKSTLLSLVTGDHPQCYSNNLTLFGRRRGSGETIWDIKKHIGYVSSSLHLDYRVSTTVRNVILSGYFDSIGIYQAVSDKQRKLVDEWLAILGMDARSADAPFHSLSWGQQRLALIVRALVKHPTLLILDEPLQGLDPLNRLVVRRFIDVLISEGKTQLLFVSHHAEDAPECITHRLEFVADGDGYRYEVGPLL